MVVPLPFAECNKSLTIKDIIGDKSKLTEKGFCVGSEISLLKNFNNNFVVKVGESQYVIGFGFAKNIMIEY